MERLVNVSSEKIISGALMGPGSIRIVRKNGTISRSKKVFEGAKFKFSNAKMLDIAGFLIIGKFRIEATEVKNDPECKPPASSITEQIIKISMEEIKIELKELITAHIGMLTDELQAVKLQNNSLKNMVNNQGSEITSTPSTPIKKLYRDESPHVAVTLPCDCAPPSIDDDELDLAGIKAKTQKFQKECDKLYKNKIRSKYNAKDPSSKAETFTELMLWCRDLYVASQAINYFNSRGYEATRHFDEMYKRFWVFKMASSERISEHVMEKFFFCDYIDS